MTPTGRNLDNDGSMDTRLRKCEEWILTTEVEFEHVEKWRDKAEERFRDLEKFAIQIKFIASLLLGISGVGMFIYKIVFGK